MTSHLKNFDTPKEQSIIVSDAMPMAQFVKDKIHERLRLPLDQWIDMVDDTVFDDVINTLRMDKPNS